MDTSLHLQLTHSVNYPGGHVTYPQTTTKADDINKIHTSNRHESEDRTISYAPRFLPFDLWPKVVARGKPRGTYVKWGK